MFIETSRELKYRTLPKYYYFLYFPPVTGHLVYSMSQSYHISFQPLDFLM